MEYCRFVGVLFVKRYRHSMLVLPVIGLVLFFLLTAFLFYINYSHFSIELLRFYKSTEAVFFLVQILLLLYLNRAVILLTERFFKQHSVSRMQLLTESFLVVSGSFLLLLVLRYFFVYWRAITPDDFPSLERIRRAQTISLFLSLLVYGGMILNRYFISFRKKQFEASRWENDLALVQLEALKTQLNPELLFSSLDLLTGLVHSDPREAELFIGKLSKTYRYLLEHRREKLVSVEAELGFLEQYRQLLLHRFGAKLNLTMVGIEPGSGHLIPHTMLIVTEYIIHSSSMSEHNPLRIEVNSKQSHIQFSFSHQPKNRVHPTAVQQLEVLKQQYADLKRPIYSEADVQLKTDHIQIALLP